MYDVVIIGGGPAGLTAAIYASRRALKALILSRDLGGQAARTYDIENYPGLPKISGIDLTKTMKIQAENFGAEFKYEEVKQIKKLKSDFSIQTINHKYRAKSIILAFGKQPRELKIKGEEEFKGRGVSYCATCDAPFYKNKTIIIVGGGNSALDAAILTSKIAKKVYLVHRSQFSAEQVLIDKANKLKNIEVIMPDNLIEIKGDKVVKSAILESGKEIATDGVMVEIGYVVDRSLIKDFIKTNDNNQIEVNNIQETSKKGVFAAGDLTITPYKQIVIATGEGAKAALSCYDYIQRIEGKKGIIGDWQKLNKK